MWHEDEVIQHECVSRIAKVAQISDPGLRYRRALQEISRISTLPLDEECRTRFARVIAQYALHPDTPRGRDQPSRSSSELGSWPAPK